MMLSHRKTTTSRKLNVTESEIEGRNSKKTRNHTESIIKGRKSEMEGQQQEKNDPANQKFRISGKSKT